MAKAFQRSYKFLPEVFQTSLNRRFLASTMDHLVTPSDPRQLNYYVGRRYAKGATSTDRFLTENNELRNAYQLEVGAASVNPDGTYAFGATAEDFINALNYYGVDKNNLQNALADDFKPADFKISLDKLINYDQYYWMPNGPDAIPISFAIANLLFIKLSAFDNTVLGYYDDKNIYVSTSNQSSLVDSFPTVDVTRAVADTTVAFKLPRDPQIRQSQNQVAVPAGSMIGVATNGHPFYTYTMGSKEKLNDVTYTINTPFLENHTITFDSTSSNLANEFNRSEDVQHVSPTEFAGHPDINGVFHYHAYSSELGDSVSGHSKILGYAFDGFPIYGPRGYTNADGSGSIINMTSSYRIKGATAVRGTPDGRYVEDYEYIANLGTLDVNNGRFCVTPDFPNGTYAYFLTVDNANDPVFPYVVGPSWTGSPIQQSSTIQVPTTASAFTGVPSIDIERDVIGQQRFAIGDVTFMNGLKVTFDATVLPASYRNKTYYVEGVGSSIRLLDVDLLVPNGLEQDINYGFLNKHYITIARSSLDGNAWSRSNRWFHYRVLEHTAKVLEQDFVIDQAEKAKRPVVEFDNDIALYNHARRNVAVVDAFDQVEIDALSNVMAASGYSADGVGLENGMKVVFSADTDLQVRNKIYEVTIASLDEGRKSIYNPGAIGTAPYEWLATNTGDVFNIQGDFRNKTIELKNGDDIIPSNLYSTDVVYNIPAITEITVTNGGSGYATAPTVSLIDTVTSLPVGGSAVATLVGDAVDFITITNPTTSTTAVTVVIAAPGAGVTATAGVTIGTEERIEITLVTTLLSLDDIELTAYDYQPNIVLTEVASVSDYDGIVVTDGNSNAGKNFYYLNNEWVQSQNKTAINQEPLFDLFDSNKTSIGDRATYVGSTFIGSKLFSFKRGTGTNDSEIGFPLSYKSVGLTGDIQFEWNHSQDIFQFTLSETTTELACESFYTLNVNDDSLRSVVLDSPIIGKPPVIDLRYVDVETNEVELKISVIESDVQQTVIVELNDQLLYQGQDYDLVDRVIDYATAVDGKVKQVKANSLLVFRNTLKVNDKLMITHWTNDDITETDLVLRLPLSLTTNPSNQQISVMTFGELASHLTSGAQLLTTLDGRSVGNNNLFIQPTLDSYCTKFGYHNGNILLAMALLKNRTLGFVQSLEYARNEFTKFKNSVIQKYNTVVFDEENPVPTMLDSILSEYVLGKTADFPFYDSDMVPGYTNFVENSYKVRYQEDKTYPLTTAYVDEESNRKAVLVYHNGILLARYQDYDFDTPLSSLTISTNYPLTQNDVIVVRQYDTTTENWVAATPAKLGIAPAYVPALTTIQQPSGLVTVIRGHDGSLTPAFGDQRDELLLELENRIYNNIKKQGSDSYKQVLDKFALLPGYYRSSERDFQNYIDVFDRFFGQWILKSKLNYSSHPVTSDPWQWNYRGQEDVFGNKILIGSWFGVYRHYFDTPYPNVTPWEMLGFHEEPTWWASEYGTAPYTKQNTKLWEDLEQGLIRQGYRAGVDTRYVRYNAEHRLQDIIPVDDHGVLLSPDASQLVKITDQRLLNRDWQFGDCSPVEQAWIRSSEYPFAVQLYQALTNSRLYFGSGFDLLDTAFDAVTNTLQKIYDTTITSVGKVVRQSDVEASVTNTYTTGYFVWIQARAKSLNIDLSEFNNFVSGICPRLMFRMTGFTDKDKLQVYINAVAPGSKNSLSLLPDSNYQLLLDQSSPIDTLTYSGVIITRTDTGWRVEGYDTEKAYFSILPSLHDEGQKDSLRVGEQSSSYLDWRDGYYYIKGQVVKYNGLFFRVTTDHTSSSAFDFENFAALQTLPVQGGIVATYWKTFSTNPAKVYYGTVFSTAQEVFDFIIAYGRYLENQGFVFDQFDNDLGSIRNWILSGREFLFWSLQNWNNGSSLTLSPASQFVQMYVPQGDLDPLYGVYSDPNGVLDQNGTPLRANSIAVDRNFDLITVSSVTADRSIYLLKAVISEFDHLVVFDDKTDFSDIVFDSTTGARQERLKIKGSKSNSWNGKLFAPGFTLDQANINDWQSYTDYRNGDLVKISTTVYITTTVHNSGDIFDYSKWKKLAKQPKKFLQPNLESMAARLEQFYDLSVDQITSDVSSYARHLIGFQPRDYLQSLLVDDESQFKFYQGMITQKGTEQAVTKLLRGINPNSELSVDIKDEWAFRIGEFGLADNTDEVELLLDSNDLEFSKIALDLDNATSYERNVVGIPADKILDQGERVSGSIFPLTTAKFKQKYAGYARIDQVDATVLSHDQLSNINASLMNKNGTIIWVAQTALTDSAIYKTKRFGPFNITILANDVVSLDSKLDLAENEDIWLVTLDDLTYSEVSAPGQLQPVPGINGYQVVQTVESTTSFTIVNGTGLNEGDTFSAFIVKLLPVQYNNFNSVEFNVITAATNTNPVVLTFANDHSYIGGERLIIDRIAGMAELNGKVYYAKYVSTNKISLYDDQALTIPVNSQAYNTYTAAGVAYSSHIDSAVRVYESEVGDRLWIDAYDGGWAVLKKQDPWLVGPQPAGLTAPTSNYSVTGSRVHAWTYRSIIWTAARAEATAAGGQTDQAVLIFERSEAGGDLAYVDRLRGSTSDVSAACEFGYSISHLDSETLIIGCPANSIIGTEYGSVQVWNRGPTGDWTLGYTIDAPVGITSAKFGTTLARVSDTLMLIGSPGEATIYKLKYGNFTLPVKNITVNSYPDPIDMTFGIAACTTSVSSAYVTTASSVAGVQIGTQVSGTGVQSNTVIINIEEDYTPGVNRITLSKTATAAGTIALNLYHGLSDKQAITITGVTGVVQSNSNAINGGTFYVEKIDNFAVSLYIDEDLTTPVVGLGTHTAYTGSAAATDTYSIQLAPVTQTATGTGIVMAADSNKVAILDTAGNGHIYVYTIDENGILTQDINAIVTGTTSIPIKSQHPIDITTVGENVRVAVGSRFTTYDTFGTIIDTGDTTFDTLVSDGIVRIYDFSATSGTASLTQVLTGPNTNGLNLFGKTVKFTTSGKLLVGNPTAPYVWKLILDSSTTTFDANDTTFTDVIIGYGAVESFGLHSRYGAAPGSSLYSTQYVWEGSVFNPISAVDDSTTGFGSALSEVNDTVIIASPWSVRGKIYEYDNTQDGWAAETQQEQVVDTKLINRALSYDPVQDQVIEFLSLWDPLKDLHDSEAMINVDYTLSIDPSIYQENSPGNTFWAEEKVGTTWWDNSTAVWLWYEQGDLSYKIKNWGQLFPGSTITVCEWIESTTVPSAYNVNGMTPSMGTPPLGGLQPYNTKVTTDSNGATVFRYYFWVAGKQSISQSSKKTLSVASIATALTNGPYQWVAAAGSAGVVTQNLRDNLVDGEQILQIEVLRVEQNSPRHVEWTLLSEGDNVAPPTSLVNKMVDSLTGRDLAGNNVPDVELAAHKRLGVKIRPRQTMFNDRVGAIEVCAEYLNEYLASIIVEDVDLGTMNQSDPQPLIMEVQDLTIDTGDTTFDDGSTTLTTEYQNWDESVPTYADIIVSDLLAKPAGYLLLVESDETRKNLWTIYMWDGTNLMLSRVQKYDTTRYWSRLDYYSTDYPEGSIAAVTLATEQEFQDSNYVDTNVKVLGPGYWRVLRKDSTGDTTIMALENGTIKLDITAADFNTSMSFDTSSFDSAVFDSEPTIELRNILTAMRDNVFVNEYKYLWNSWFFRMVRHALVEQRQLDWAFKSSFIKVKHFVAELAERPVYALDIDDSLEKYITEVKPYHTKIREYTSVYSGKDVFGSLTTDFDCPPHLVDNHYETSVVDDPEQASRFENEWPWRSYRDNRGYSVVAIVVADGGTGYDIAPTIKLTGGKTVLEGNVRLASAYAVNLGFAQSFETLGADNYFSARKLWLDQQAIKDSSIDTTDLPGDVLANVAGGPGVVNLDAIRQIIVVDEGEGYLTPPTVEIVSLPGHGSGARAYAVLGKTPVRMFKTGMRFDRVKGTADILYPETRDPAQDNPGFDDWHAADRIAAFYDPQPGQAGIPERIIQTHIGDGVTTTFDLPQDFMYEELMQVALGDILVEPSDYTVYPSEMTINFATAPSNNTTISLILNPPLLPLLLGADYDQTKIVSPKFSTGPGFASQARGFDSVDFDNWELDPYGNLVELGGYDTYQSGGRFASSSGYDPSAEVSNSGGSFIGPDTTPSTEELVSGQVFDALDVKVFTAESQNQNISIQTISGNGTTTYFALNPVPSSVDNITVFVNGLVQDPGVAYIIDYSNILGQINAELQFNTAPAANSIITAVVTNDNGPSVEQVQNFVGNGSSEVFRVTGVGLDNPLRQCIVVVDGIKTAHTFASDSAPYENDVLVTISPAPAIGAVIRIVSYLTVAGVPVDLKNYTESFVESIFINGSLNYTITNPSGAPAPLSTSTIAYAVAEGAEAGLRLTPPATAYALGTGATAQFNIPVCPNFNIAGLVAGDIQATVNGQIVSISSYSSGVVTLTATPALNDVVTITVLPSGDYYVQGSTLTLTSMVDDGSTNTKILVTTYNDTALTGIRTEVFGIDNTLHIQYQGYGIYGIGLSPTQQQLANFYSRGQIVLSDDIIAVNRVQVYKNGVYIAPVVGWYLQAESNRIVNIAGGIDDNDVIVVHYFAGTSTTSSTIGFRVFKDMMGSLSAYRLPLENSTTVSQAVTTASDRIYLTNASALVAPSPLINRPGVVMIGKERIEYWEKGSDYISRLRRATKGTGAGNHRVGTLAVDMSYRNQLPASEYMNSETYSANGATVSFALPLLLTTSEHDTDSVLVYVAGKKMTSGYTVDQSAGSYYQVTFNEAPKSGLRVVLAIKQAYNWYDVTDPTSSMADTDTQWAIFIREKTTVFDIS